jgi:hypothetical protein
MISDKPKSLLIECNLKRRADVREIIELNDKAFEGWYQTQMTNIHCLLSQWELFEAIPNLRSSEHNIGSYSCVRDIVARLRDGLEYIKAIKERRDFEKKELSCEPTT